MGLEGFTMYIISQGSGKACTVGRLMLNCRRPDWRCACHDMHRAGRFPVMLIEIAIDKFRTYCLISSPGAPKGLWYKVGIIHMPGDPGL